MTSPATLRAVRSTAALRARGGDVKTLRLSPDAIRRIATMIAAGRARNQQDAIERALEIACAGMGAAQG